MTTALTRARVCMAGVHLCTAMFLGGCALTGPDFDTPEVVVPDEWNADPTPGFTSQTPEYNRWWEVFDDPVLNTLVQTAYEQNLTLQVAGLRVLEARAQLGIVTGSLYPQSQTMSGNYLYNRGPGGDYFNSAGIGFDAAWELDFWGKFRRGVESADANLIANIASYDDVLVTLTAEVARTYVTIRTLQERIRLAQQNIKIQQRSLELTTNQFETGSVTELDMQQATTQLRNTQASIPNLLISLEQTQHALSILLGMPPQHRPRSPPVFRPNCCGAARISSRPSCRLLLNRRRSVLPRPSYSRVSPCLARLAGTSMMPAMTALVTCSNPTT
jgi:outer membrane protein TolC